MLQIQQHCTPNHDHRHLNKASVTGRGYVNQIPTFVKLATFQLCTEKWVPAPDSLFHLERNGWHVTSGCEGHERIQ